MPSDSPIAVPATAAAAAAGAAAAPDLDDRARQLLHLAQHDLAGAWTHVRALILTGAGEGLGYAEMLGLHYPVKVYSARVDDNLMRGSRVDLPHMTQLKQEGIRGIVNLCAENNDDEAVAQGLGLMPLHIPIMDNFPPRPEQIDQFLAFATSVTPCYVHCEAGQGRTGVACACYRIAVDGWTVDAALAEGKTYGLQMQHHIEFIQQFGVRFAARKAAANPPV